MTRDPQGDINGSVSTKIQQIRGRGLYVFTKNSFTGTLDHGLV